MDNGPWTLTASLTLYLEEHLSARNFTERTRRAYTDDVRDAPAAYALKGRALLRKRQQHDHQCEQRRGAVPYPGQHRADACLAVSE
jgi:hypothetical protein